ncbi:MULTISPECIES: hypothetical protein [Amycolatopsis]|uniref:hypothetical protein n=1 Tax=Amycolatopsis TaxID=1813 RepID=UPI0013B4281B|nr:MULTISPECIES: hypothetical protein [Amycolatopsis]
MTTPITQQHDDQEGRHVLHEADECTRRDVVYLYGEITNLVMPVPRRDAPARHWNGQVA